MTTAVMTPAWRLFDDAAGVVSWVAFGGLILTWSRHLEILELTVKVRGRRLDWPILTLVLYLGIYVLKAVADGLRHRWGAMFSDLSVDCVMVTVVLAGRALVALIYRRRLRIRR